MVKRGAILIGVGGFTAYSQGANLIEQKQKCGSKAEVFARAWDTFKNFKESLSHLFLTADEFIASICIR